MSNLAMSPLISIGMPIWNCSTTVTESLLSIMNQSYTNWELLVSDNCSTDGTFELVQNLVKDDSRVKLEQQEFNRGGWSNFLYVFSFTQGEYFKFHAGDDVLSPDYLESIVRTFQDFPEAIGVCSPDVWDYERDNSQTGNSFEFVGSQEARLNTLTRYCWKSNGVFYGVFKTKSLRLAITPEIFTRKIQILDWLVLAKILKQGVIKRADSGLLILGSNGASNSNPDTWINQLQGFSNKTFPYRGFVKLFKTGDIPVSHRSKLIMVGWIINLTLRHFKGLIRLGLHNSGVRPYSR
jgi:glycosyltransferase involved in cell wall biosynthesis